MAIFFEDGFESDASDWIATDGPLTNWDDNYLGSTIYDGYCMWRIGEGRNGGNAVYNYEKSGVPNGYHGEGRKWFTGGDIKTEIYHRWYMKIPTAENYNKAIAEGFKFHRYIMRENGYSGPEEIFLNAYNGATFAAANLTLFNGSLDPSVTLVPISEVNDNQWHCYELHIKLNSNGQADGLVEFWLDGILESSEYDLNWGFDSQQPIAFHNVDVGIGNVSDSDWYQSDWSAIAFDDIVVSTTYVGRDMKYLGTNGKNISKLFGVDKKNITKFLGY